MRCPACGNDVRAGAKFCDECGTEVAAVGPVAEYKQVTVLFADVVRSMDIAATLGPERLRELMSEVFDRCAGTVARYSGTVDKFTGDGMMAVFGAPLSLEDHAFRACMAALEIQGEIRALADTARTRDDIELSLRIGLNSGEVIAGEIGSRAHTYTTIGDQVGMAQRMESVASPGGVTVSESTARLVGNQASLGERHLVSVKGFETRVPVFELLSATGRRAEKAERTSTFVGRDWELSALAAMLDRAAGGHGCVVGIVGPPGIGKSRIAAETVSLAADRGMTVCSTYCESHTADVPFQVANRLLRSAWGVDGLDDDAARERVRSRAAGADPADIVLLMDELGIRDPVDELPDIAPEARRRRIAALVNDAVLARREPVLYVIEDAHWIDSTSEALLADFLAVVPRTHSMAIVTSRPEYTGALSRSPGAQTISLAPLDGSQLNGLIAELLGTEPSVAALADIIAERASGNPFFVEEITRDLVDRGVLRGDRGSYTCQDDAADVEVPPTVHAAIAARIDRLDPLAKRAVNAAAVIGLRFDHATLTALVDDADVDSLVTAELVDQIVFTPAKKYAFHHPLIRTVAYRSQLTATRAELHRRLAHIIEDRDPANAVDHAALIAEHYQAAGEFAAAFAWHMRAGEWLRFRDVHACRLSWRRAGHVADKMPDGVAGRDAMRIVPRTLLIASNFRAGGTVDDADFAELRQLTDAAGDNRSLAMAMSGRVSTLAVRGRYREAAQEADELVGLIHAIDDPDWELPLLVGASMAKLMSGEIEDGVRIADRMVQIADDDFHKGEYVIESPLCCGLMLRGVGRMSMGVPGWKRDVDEAELLSQQYIPVGESVVVSWKYGLCVVMGAVRVDDRVIATVSDIAARAERHGDDLGVETGRFILGLCLAQQDGPARQRGLTLLDGAREAVLQDRTIAAILPMVDSEKAREAARNGDIEAAIDMLGSLLHHSFVPPAYQRFVSQRLVEVRLARGERGDLAAAEAVVDQAEAEAQPGNALADVALLRMKALLAHGRGDAQGYGRAKALYRERAIQAGFEGHIDMADAMD